MNKVELAALIADRLGKSKKEAGEFLEVFLDVMAETMVAGDAIKLSGFGTFEVTEKAAHMGRNPKTGESMMISAYKSPKFKASSVLKKAIKGEA